MVNAATDQPMEYGAPFHVIWGEVESFSSTPESSSAPTSASNSGRSSQDVNNPGARASVADVERQARVRSSNTVWCKVGSAGMDRSRTSESSHSVGRDARLKSGAQDCGTSQAVPENCSLDVVDIEGAANAGSAESSRGASSSTHPRLGERQAVGLVDGEGLQAATVEQPFHEVDMENLFRLSGETFSAHSLAAPAVEISLFETCISAPSSNLLPPIGERHWQAEENLATGNISSIVPIADAGNNPGEEPVDLPSLGSTFHVRGKCSPCKFWLQGTCKMGFHCCFCHISHASEKKKRLRPSKKAREKRSLHSQYADHWGDLNGNFMTHGASPEVPSTSSGHR